MASCSSVRPSRQRPSLLLGQRLLELQELLEEGLGVDAAGVVVGDELLEPLDEVDARRVEANERGELRGEQRAQPLRRGPRPALLERLFEPLPVDGSEVEQSVGVAVGDQVLVGGDGFVEELLDAAHDASDVGRSV